jgi:hypothetical protein
MTDSANSSQLWPEALIGEATGVIMIAFDLDAAQALQVLRRMSQNTGVQMRVAAQQIINRKVPVAALRGVEQDVPGFWASISDYDKVNSTGNAKFVSQGAGKT